MSRQLQEWLTSGEYLPEIIRDFHSQKSLFKRIQEISDRYKWGVTDRPNWIAAHLYTIDIFLWFMAKHGYTLQKTRQKVEGITQLSETISEFERRDLSIEFASLRSRNRDDLTNA